MDNEDIEFTFRAFRYSINTLQARAKAMEERVHALAFDMEDMRDDIMRLKEAVKCLAVVSFILLVVVIVLIFEV